MVPPSRIELLTPSLPMTCSTTELRRRRNQKIGARGENCSLHVARGPCHSVKAHASLPRHFPSKATGIVLAMTGGRRDDANAKDGAKSRRDRLDEALRANLAKRKAQARARRETATSPGNDRRKPDGYGE
jgi:hypothetical protein